MTFEFNKFCSKKILLYCKFISKFDFSPHAEIKITENKSMNIFFIFNYAKTLARDINLVQDFPQSFAQKYPRFYSSNQ